MMTTINVLALTTIYCMYVVRCTASHHTRSNDLSCNDWPTLYILDSSNTMQIPTFCAELVGRVW